MPCLGVRRVCSAGGQRRERGDQGATRADARSSNRDCSQFKFNRARVRAGVSGGARGAFRDIREG
jgi:hypothetical protein